MDKTATAMPVYRETQRYVNGCTCSPMAVIRAIMQAKPTNSVLTRRGRQRSKDMYGSSIAGTRWVLDVGSRMLDVGCRAPPAARWRGLAASVSHGRSLS